jgi:L-asparagine transporter-like permease
MESVARKLSPAAFVLALICFFLPFVTFSCQGQEVASFSGMQLATGTKVQQPQIFGAPKSEKFSPEPLAVCALLSVLAGVGLSFLKGKKGAVGSAALAVLGVILLAALKSRLDGEALQQGRGVIQVGYQAGYYLTLVFLLVAAGTGIYALVGNKGSLVPAVQSGGDGKFCGQCGTQNSAANLFCQKCGAKFS